MKIRQSHLHKFLASTTLTLAAAILWPYSSALAAAQLTITPITWNIIGLDSNNVSVGPNVFMTGARVCNTGSTAATNVKATFVREGNTNSFINLQGASTLSISSLAAGSTTAANTRPPTFYGAVPSNCTDFYYNIVIIRSSAAYNTKQLYRIEATADNLGIVSTPTNRELYVEKLISQNRNSVATITGPSTVVVGQTYQYIVTGSTATGGYEQLVFSPNFPNTIFQVVGVTATYTAPSSVTNNSIYADACGWTNDITSSTYHNNLECTDTSIPDGYSGGKAGNNVSTTYTVKILSSGTATFVNLIYDFSGSSYHYNTDYNDATKGTTITAIDPPDLTITKSHTGDFTQGGNGTYNLTAKNSGSSPTLQPVTVVDDLPTGLTPTTASGTGWTCTVSGQKVTCTRSDTLASGASYPAISLNVAVASNASSSLTNVANVSGGGETNITNNNASDPTIINGVPDLTITKTHTGNFTQGVSGTYTITAKNSGGAATNGLVTVSDTLPTGLTPTTATGTGWTCTISSQTVTCTRSDTLAAGSSYPDISLSVTPASNAASSLTNIANVSGGGQTNTTNDSASDPTIINGVPDLTITKIHIGNFTQGVSGTYTITAKNSGGAATNGLVTVSDTLPTGLTPTTATGTGWTCTVSGQTVTCTRSDVLGTGASYPAISLSVTPASNAASSLTNVASVSGGDQTNITNDSASDPTTINGIPDLTITKIHIGNFTQGVSGTYTITAKNSGGAATNGLVTVTDTLPTGLTPTTATGTGWTCTVSGQTVTCTRSDVLGTGASYPAISLSITAASNAAFSLTNVANVSGGGQTNTTNDSASDPTIINGFAKLILVKRITAINGNTSNGSVSLTQVVDDPNTTDDNNSKWPANYLKGAIDGGKVKPGDELEYTIYFLSSGSIPAKNVTVCDLMPISTTFVPTAFTSNSGITLAIGSTTPVFLTNASDTDGGQFIVVGTETPGSCNKAAFSNPTPPPLPAAQNLEGAVVVDVVTGSTTFPANTTGSPAYGFIRLRAKVK
ncbi:MAG TPA: hypothetical protein VE944_00030 [Nostoc sp.]|uniref:beta strand repeat-containing protein n=1 Tax=Nostoc sp. TaxID=1180 RepID=UPI002D6155A8|nr:hypothetical protein [Nostoc sp.]HYX12763.1 hypothetical protein [Nostoc sp.]